MDNIKLYNKLRKVPNEAKKPINGGRLKGMTDINPMWRIKALTEEFGPCGIGWSYSITNQWLEEGANDEKVAFTNIELKVKIDGEWSEAIPGTGGSSFIAKERTGLYTSDEAYKMALTDAISIACKALGVGADVYFEKDRTKYSPSEEGPQASNKITVPQQKRLVAKAKSKKDVISEVLKEYNYKQLADIEKKDYDKMCEKAEFLA